MVMTTGSYPAALSGGGEPDTKPSKAPSPTSSPKKDSGEYDREFLAGQEKGYSPRKAMAAGIVKC